MKNPLIKLLAAALVVIMLVGMVPVYAFAAIDYNEGTNDYYKLISQKNWDLAPGITESEIVIDNEAGTRRQVMHVVEVDIHNEYTKVIPSIKGMIPTVGKYGTQTMDQQAAYAEANGYGNVVAAMNISLSWYDSQYYVDHPELVGEPLGYMILDGVQYTNSKGQTSGAQSVLVINFDEKDGVARPADMPKTEIRSTSSAITGWEEQVIPANFGFLVKNGKVVTTKVDHTSAGAPRSMLGIKADGTIIMVMNDGRQAPYSEGFNSYEMGEAMLKLGCVYAINGDGGGSSQFLSQRPGEELAMHCSPSDGTLRPTTHGVLVISTAPATGEFVRAHVDVEHDYYTPGSSIQFTAEGSDLVGTPADIPADAIWRVTEGMGTIDANGLFTSNGTVGKVTAELVYQGEVVGSASTNVVIPDKIEFPQAVITVPNGESTKLVVKAWYNEIHEVTTKVSDFAVTLSDNSIGTLDGFTFTAVADTAVTGGHITVTLVHDTAKTAEADFRFGKASEVIWDFENGTDDWKTTMWKASASLPHAYLAKSDVYAVTAANGKVHNGNGAMALVADFSYGNSTSWNSFYLNYYGETITIENAQAIGCWLYIPDEIPYIEFSLRFYPNGSSSPKNALVAYSDPSEPLQPGWTYVSFDISAYKSITFKSGYQFIQVYYGGIQGVSSLLPYPELNSKVTYYLDNVTIDYSTAVADREAPVFDVPSVLNSVTESASEMNGQTVTDAINSFEVSVKDFQKDNSVGIDSATAKTYVDGVAVDCQYFGGRIVASDVKLANGVHTITFEIADMNGNVARVSRQINIQADSDIPSVSVVPHDATLDRILIGSLYYVDLVASNMEKTDKVVVTLDLNNHSAWELDHMTVAEGFEATYEIDATDPMDLIALVTITRVGENATVGSGVLASLPIRTWEWKADENPAKGDKEEVTPAERWADKLVFRTIVAVDNVAGVLTLTDATEVPFGAARIQVDTELFANSASGVPNDAVFEGKDGWHVHTAEAIADKAPTCTKDGYTGRTYCAVCDSVVDWGTKIPATGHTYTVVDDHLVCDCGHMITESGLLNVNGTAYYAVNGELRHSWIELDDGWYYFNTRTYAGPNGKHTTLDGITFDFENGRLVSGIWQETSAGMRYWYGPTFYRDQTNEVTSSRPYVIDGKTYLFNRAGIMQTGIVTSFVASGTLYYDCGTDGVATLLSGVYRDQLYIDGVRQVRYRLVELDGNIYFINDGDMLLKNGRVYLSDTYVAGKTLPDGRVMQPGYYTFDAEGKMIIEPVKHGVVGDFLYIDDVKQTRYKLVEFEGNFYFINDGDKIAKNTKLYLSDCFVSGKTFPDGRPIQVGTYEFDAEGKMIIPELKNGVVDDRLYINDVLQKAYQLVEFEGNYYFINDGNNRIAKNIKLYLSEKYVTGKTFADGRAIQPGTYEFDAEGKMIIPEMKNGVVDDRLYINDVLQKAYQLVEFEGNYYFINDGNNRIAKNTKLYLSEKYVTGKTFADGRAIQPGTYEFDAEGKMIIPELKNGVVDDRLYINDVLQKAYQLVEFEGNYYFINDGNNRIAKNTKLYLSEKYVAGTDLAPGLYSFDAEGKLILN